MSTAQFDVKEDICWTNFINFCSGIISRLDHLEYIGVETIWLSPIYPSPMADFGYDVSDYTDVDPLFGTLEDFDELIKALHDKGMKLVMDFIPNHTSNKHRWFEASRKREQPYDEFYVWADGSQKEGGTRVPPNQWVLLLRNLSEESLLRDFPLVDSKVVCFRISI